MGEKGTLWRDPDDINLTEMKKIHRRKLFAFIKARIIESLEQLFCENGFHWDTRDSELTYTELIPTTCCICGRKDYDPLPTIENDSFK